MTYLRIVAPAYGALGLGFVIAFAAQGAGHVLWPFVGAASRLIIAAGCGWLAVSYFGAGMATLAAMVAASLVSYAVICAAAMFFGGIWKIQLP
jgi:Na+-driven multidrug efflux pump